MELLPLLSFLPLFLSPSLPPSVPLSLSLPPSLPHSYLTLLSLPTLRII